MDWYVGSENESQIILVWIQFGRVKWLHESFKIEKNMNRATGLLQTHEEENQSNEQNRFQKYKINKQMPNQNK